MSARAEELRRATVHGVYYELVHVGEALALANGGLEPGVFGDDGVLSVQSEALRRGHGKGC